MSYCNITTDLEEVCPNLSDYFHRKVLPEDWVLASGQTNTYQIEGYGYVEMVFDDGEKLTSKTSVALTEASAGSFYPDTANDILYVHTKGSDDLTSSPPTIQIGVDEVTYLTKHRNSAEEIMDSYLGSQLIVPLQPRLVKVHSSNDYEAPARLACANLTVALAIRQFDFEEANKYEMIALGFNPPDGVEKGYIAKIVAGEIALQDQITAREAQGAPNVYPSASNTTGYIRIQPKISRYTGSDMMYIRLQIDTAGAPGTATWKRSDDGGTNWDVTLQKTFDTDNDSRRILIGYGIYVVFWGTFVEGDYWDLELFPTTDEVTIQNIGSIEMTRGA